jgi:hypothetical protein
MVACTERIWVLALTSVTFRVLENTLLAGKACLWNSTYIQLQYSMLIPKVSLTKLNSVTLVRERTIPTERPPLVGEVIANFCGQRVSRGQRDGFPWSLISVL